MIDMYIEHVYTCLNMYICIDLSIFWYKANFLLV